MKKIYLSLLIVFGLVGLVSAITIGTILTQNQLDNQDVMNTDLEDNFLRDESNKVVHNRSGTEEVFYVEILSIDKRMLINETTNFTYWGGDYEIIELTFDIYVDINRWKNRKDLVGITQAKQELKEWLKEKKNRIEARERGRIMALQTNPNNLDDFNLEDFVI